MKDYCEKGNGNLCKVQYHGGRGRKGTESERGGEKGASHFGEVIIEAAASHLDAVTKAGAIFMATEVKSVRNLGSQYHLRVARSSRRARSLCSGEESILKRYEAARRRRKRRTRSLIRSISTGD